MGGETERLQWIVSDSVYVYVCVCACVYTHRYLGACHALASEISTITGVNMGLISGVLLPHVLDFMAKNNKVRRATHPLTVCDVCLTVLSAL